jgi:hypothetical protein
MPDQSLAAKIAAKRHMPASVSAITEQDEDASHGDFL